MNEKEIRVLVEEDIEHDKISPSLHLLPPMQLRKGETFGSIQHLRTLRSVTMEIKNYHKNLSLVSPKYYLDAGQVEKDSPPPALIRTETSETFTFSKVHGSLTGTAGVLTYELLLTNDHNSTIPQVHGQTIVPAKEILGRDKRFINIMWSAPIFYPYYQAVGIFGASPFIMAEVYRQMYYGPARIFSRGAASENTLYECNVYDFPVTIISKITDDNNAKLVVEIK